MEIIKTSSFLGKQFIKYSLFRHPMDKLINIYLDFKVSFITFASQLLFLKNNPICTKVSKGGFKMIKVNLFRIKELCLTIS